MDYVIKDIRDKYNRLEYSHISICNIDEDVIMDFVSLNGDIKIVEFTERIRSREQLLDYLSECGIHSVIGVGSTNVIKVGFHESKLLEYLEYNGVVRNFKFEPDYRYEVLWCLEDRIDNILYEVNSEYLTLSKLCYTIDGDILIVHVPADIGFYSSYKLLCSRKEFDRLITKIKTLERSY